MDLNFLKKIATKIFFAEFLQNFGWAVLILPWDKVNCVPLQELSDLDPRSPKWVNHEWFEESSFRGFPRKLKSVGRTVAATERDQKQ